MEEIKKEIKICIETNENENTTIQNLWEEVKRFQMGGSKEVLRGKFIILPQETRKISNKQPNLTLEVTRKRKK